METKNFFILLIFVLTFCNIQNNSAQNEPAVYKNEIRMGIIQLAQGGMNINYEKFFNNKSVVLIEETIYKVNYDKEIFGIYTELQYRSYIIQFKDTEPLNFFPDGIYVAPAIKFRYLETEEYQNSNKIYSYGYNLLMGLKYIIFERLTFDINFGGSFMYSKFNSDNTEYQSNERMNNLNYRGVGPIANFTCGFKF